MSISEKEVRHIANLSKLGIEDNEVSFYSKEMSSILEYMQKLQKVKLPDDRQIEGVEYGRERRVREDASLLFSARSFSDILLSMTNKTKAGFVKIKQVLYK